MNDYDELEAVLWLKRQRPLWIPREFWVDYYRGNRTATQRTHNFILARRARIAGLRCTTPPRGMQRPPRSTWHFTEFVRCFQDWKDKVEGLKIIMENRADVARRFQSTTHPIIVTKVSDLQHLVNVWREEHWAGGSRI
ncbi:hypothetical protein Pyn_20079 [Prunus yedoensis var. nudiflora]|uniref:Uncharacterized protein n=1 Tax=Prunus yedoensis var. nudiflora TaxID=2094558 RepID=A0A314Z6X9_PRUYE|nr:hypothetical protein Pyn_20079 [Prunus yedoensis var. nudiflora]